MEHDSLYQRLAQLTEEFTKENHDLAIWWLEHGVDHQHGGYFGSVSASNFPDRKADKSLILHARNLWYFAELARSQPLHQYVEEAKRAYDYLCSQFWDSENGGVFWFVDFSGQVIEPKKQVYGQAFALYAFSAYFSLTGEIVVLHQMLTIFDCISKRCIDFESGGALEAFSRNWGKTEDVRLSEKEDQSPKTMNTNLHVLEAYTALLQVIPLSHERRASVVDALRSQLMVFCENIVDVDQGHLRMFMDMEWQDRSHAISFGHDIEASWLLLEALSALGEDIPLVEICAKRLAESTFQDALTSSGRVRDEYDFQTREETASAWWVHFEAMVGFAVAWQMGWGNKYIQAVERTWRYLQLEYKNKEYGEWVWFAHSDRNKADIGYKTGPWKAAYHTGRALMRLQTLLEAEIKTIRS